MLKGGDPNAMLGVMKVLRIISHMYVFTNIVKRRVRLLLIIVYFHFQVDCHLLPNGPTWIWWLLLILPLGPAVQVRNITSNYTL